MQILGSSTWRSQAQKFKLDFATPFSYNIYSNLERNPLKEKNMTAKVVNYTEAMVARLHEVYDGSATDEVRKALVAELAAELGKSEASIRAKLTSEGIYVPYSKAPAGKNTVRKAALVAAIAEKLGVHIEVVESLEKANKVALAHVFKAL